MSTQTGEQLFEGIYFGYGKFAKALSIHKELVEIVEKFTPEQLLRNAFFVSSLTYGSIFLEVMLCIGLLAGNKVKKYLLILAIVFQ